MDLFEGKIAVITGGASGLGRALSEELPRHGAIVVIADITSERAGEVASSITSRGGRAQAEVVDVADAARMEKLVAQAVLRHGHLYCFFNDAGCGVVGELRDLKPEHWGRLGNGQELGVDQLNYRGQ